MQLSPRAAIRCAAKLHNPLPRKAIAADHPGTMSATDDSSRLQQASRLVS